MKINIENFPTSFGLFPHFKERLKLCTELVEMWICPRYAFINNIINIKLIIFISLLFPNVLPSQGLYPKHQAGLGFSNISGGIINYQLEISPQTAFKFGGLVYYNSENPPDDLDLVGNFGAEYQYNLIKESNKRLYLLGGISFWYMQDKETRFETINDIKYKIVKNNIKKLINAGLGIGYEYKIHSQIALSFDIGGFYQFAVQNDSDFLWLFDRVGTDNSAPSISFGIGIRYAFY